MHKRHEQITIQKSPDQPKIICNKVTKRFLNLSESVLLGLEPEPCISDFKVKKELGRGSFGQVFLCTHKKTKVNYAIKAIDKRNKTNEDGKPYFRREIEIMYKLRHPNCVRLFGNFEDETYCYFIMEYVPKGNLYNLIMANKNAGVDKILVARIIRDLINAIHYLHSMNPPIIHRDIKPENILLTDDNKIKLTDFGWANYINNQNEPRTTFCGTPLYLAPEMIENNGHGKNVDIWCIGVLLFELLVGVPPFSGKKRNILINNILKVHILWPKYPKKEIDADAKDLISKILKADPNQRISLEDMVKHPFFVKNCPDYPQCLKNVPLYHNKPYIISQDIPSNDNGFIIAKRIKIDTDISNNKRDINEITPTHISPRLYLEKKNNHINYFNSNINDKYEKSKIKKIRILNNDKDNDNDYNEEKKKLIYNKSAINFYPKVKAYKKKINTYNEQYKEELLKKIEEYEKRDKEKNKKIEELLLNNKYLTEENLSLNKRLNEKEEELEQKENKIKILQSQLLSKKIYLKNKNNSNNNNQYLEEDENNHNSFNSKKNFYTSRTPGVSPAKYKKRKKIPITPTKLYMKKNIIINNNNNNKSNNDISDGNIKEYYIPTDIAFNSTNISSLDNQEIEKLKREFDKEKKKHENDINIFINEIRSLQNENKNIKEKEKYEIIKLTRQLMDNEKEIKKYKDKVRELQMIINNNNIDEY